MLVTLLSAPTGRLQFALIVIWLAVGAAGVLTGLVCVIRANRRFRRQLPSFPAESRRHFDTAGIEVLYAAR